MELVEEDGEINIEVYLEPPYIKDYEIKEVKMSEDGRKFDITFSYTPCDDFDILENLKKALDNLNK